jgi:hypothetical protein
MNNFWLFWEWALSPAWNIIGYLMAFALIVSIVRVIVAHRS